MRFLNVPPASGTNLDLPTATLTHDHVIAGNKNTHGVLLGTSHAKNIIALQTNPHFLPLPLLHLPDLLTERNVIRLFQREITLEILSDQLPGHLDDFFVPTFKFGQGFRCRILAEPFLASGGMRGECAEDMAEDLTGLVVPRWTGETDSVHQRKVDKRRLSNMSSRHRLIQQDCLRID
jgi:hypothetical protein